MQDGEQVIILPVTLHRRSFWEIIGDTFQVYRDNFRTLFVISAVLTVTLSLINYISNVLLQTSRIEFLTSSSAEAQLSAFYGVCFSLVGNILVIVAVLVMTAALNGMITLVASEAQFGNHLSTRETWARMKPLLKKFTFAQVFYWIRIIAIGTAILLLTICGAGIGLALVGIIVYFAITFGSLLAPVAILEKLTARQSVSRTHQLTVPRFWQLAALLLLYGIFSSIVSYPIQALLGFQIVVGQPTLTQTLISTGIGIFLTPILPIAVTLFYYDSRIRIEGLDVALQRMDVEARPGDIIPTQAIDGFLEKQNLINLGIMLAIGVFGFLLLREPVLNWFEMLIEARRNLPGRPMT